MTDTLEIKNGGLTLWQALERYSDQKLWEAYRTVAAQLPNRAPPVPSHYLREGNVGRTKATEHTNYRSLKAERDRLWRQLVQAFVAMLRSAKLVAIGFEYPLRPGAIPVRAEAEHWDVLQPDFRKSEAEGGGRKLIRIRVWPAKYCPNLTSTEPDPPYKDDTPPQGRPSNLPEIEAELKRRAECGKLAQTLAAECRYLADWNNRREHCKCTYNWQSLQGALRSTYRELKSNSNDLKS